MDMIDEISLEDHRYFQARLDGLESRQPKVLLYYLEKGTLTKHLREVTEMAMRSRAELVINHNLPEDQADEIVIHQIVADPQEPFCLLNDPASWNKLRSLIQVYRAALPALPRTYMSQNETTE